MELSWSLRLKVCSAAPSQPGWSCDFCETGDSFCTYPDIPSLNPNRKNPDRVSTLFGEKNQLIADRIESVCPERTP